MELMKPQEMRTSERFETVKIKTEIEIDEEFHDVTASQKSEQIRAVDTKPVLLPEKYKFQRSDKGLEFSGVMSRFDDDVWFPLRCRLCAIPYNDLVDVFDSNETKDNIAGKIEHCLRIVVTESDILPKKVCFSCLEQLELCYRFNETVAEAEKQLLAFHRQNETERDRQTSLLCHGARGTDEYDNTEETVKTSSDVERNYESTTVLEGVQTTNTTAKRDALLASLKPLSVVLIPITTDLGNNLKKNRRRNSKDDKRRSINSSADVRDSGRISALQIKQRNTCVSRIKSRDRREKILSSRCGEGSKDKGNSAARKRAHTGEQWYSCNLCAKTFKTKGSLSRHNRFHTGRGLYNCEYCKKQFSGRIERERHHVIHTGEQPFKCPICGIRFTQAGSMRKHVATIHSENREYRCTVCNIPFKSLKQRKSHMAVHTNPKPWQCSYCKNYFIRKCNLLQHFRICKKRHRDMLPGNTRGLLEN